MEIPVFDPELQRLIDDLDHLNASIPLDSLLGGAQQQDAGFNPFAFTVDDANYLSLYDLCGGDPILVDTIRRENSGTSISSSVTPPPAPAPPAPSSDDFNFPVPTIAGKWIPGSHSGLVPTSSYLAPTPLALAAPLPVPIPFPATPDPVPASTRAGPSRSVRTAGHTRHQPYRKAAPAQRTVWSSTKRKDKGRKGRTETRDYLRAYHVKPEDITPIQGYKSLIWEGRWSPIIVDTLKQIGVPYPKAGLEKILMEVYDGEGEQEGVPKGTQGRPAHPWRVSLRTFLASRIVSDHTFLYRESSHGICVSRRKGIRPFQKTDRS